MVDHKRIQWKGGSALVRFTKSICTHRAGQKKVLPLKVANRYEKRGVVRILKILD